MAGNTVLIVAGTAALVLAGTVALVLAGTVAGHYMIGEDAFFMKGIDGNKIVSGL